MGERFNTPIIRALLLETFGERNKQLAESVLQELDLLADPAASPATDRGIGNACCQERLHIPASDLLLDEPIPASAAAADPFGILDEELREEDSLL